MKKSIPKRHLLLLLFILLFSVNANSQDSTSLFNRILSFPDKVFGRIDKEANKYEQKLTQQTEKYLNKLQRQEEKLKRKLWRTDSVKAKQVFGDVKGRYSGFRNTLKAQEDKAQGFTSTLYSGHLDSLGTAMSFLHSNPQLQQVSAIKDKLQNNLQGIVNLKNKLNQTEQIRKQIQRRQQELKQHLQSTPLAKEFQKFKKEVYYYQAQLKECRVVFENSDKAGKLILKAVAKVPGFQKYMTENSFLGSLFNSTAVYSDPINIQGMQLRAAVQQNLQQRFSAVAVNPQQLLGSQVQAARSELEKFKQKSQSFGNMSSEDEVPDFNGRVNSQKTKSFKRRLEFGSNIQFSKSNTVIPTSSDLAFSIGYKLTDRAIVGIGISGKVGLGRGLENVRLTSEGYSIRSFIDWKIKGKIFLSGGYEQNRYTNINTQTFSYLINNSQQSALIGLSRKYRISPKMGGKVSLLYDFLSKNHTPNTQSLLFRIGYNF
jgi:hypothetical protein